jgi:serine/threonine protein kinase
MISSLTDMPEGVHLVGASHIATSKDPGIVCCVASLPFDLERMFEQELNAAKLPLGESLYRYSLQPFVGGRIGRDFFEEIEGKEINNGPKWELLFERLGIAISYIHSKGIVHGDFNPGNWFFDEETGNLHIIDWGRARCGVTEEKKLDEKISIVVDLLSMSLYQKFSDRFFHLVGVLLRNLGISKSDLRSGLEMLKDNFLVLDIRNSDMCSDCPPLFPPDYFDGKDNGEFFEVVCLIKIAYLIRTRDFRDRCPSRETIIERIERARKQGTISDEEWQKRKDLYKVIINRMDPERLRAIVNDASGVLITAILSKL